MGKYGKPNRRKKRDFDYDAYWVSRKRCSECGGLTKERKSIPHDVLCAKCQDKRRLQDKKATEARTRATELDARIKREQQRAIEYDQAAKTGTPRAILNTKIRAELLSIIAETDSQYISLITEIEKSDAEIQRLKAAPPEKFEGALDGMDAVKAVAKAGLFSAFGVPFSALMFSVWIAPVIAIMAAIASSFFGNATSDTIARTGFAFFFAVICVIGIPLAFLSSLREAKKEGGERVRTALIADEQRAIKLQEAERRRAIAAIEGKAAQLRRQLERIGLTPRARKLLWERDNKTCYLCGEKIESWHGEQMHVDHLFPWSQGGSNDPENLRATHVKCNLKKSDQIIEGISSEDVRD